MKPNNPAKYGKGYKLFQTEAELDDHRAKAKIEYKKLIANAIQIINEEENEK